MIRDQEPNELPESGHYDSTHVIWLKWIAAVPLGEGPVSFWAVMTTSITAQHRAIQREVSLTKF